MAQNSAYCKAYTADRFRAFPGWTENSTSLRTGRKVVDGKDVEFARTKIEDGDILYLHDSYMVTDGIFKDENVIFDSPTDAWKKFCEDELKFSIPDYRKKASADELAKAISSGEWSKTIYLQGFTTDSSGALTNWAKVGIEEIGKVLSTAPNVKIRITGHGDTEEAGVKQANLIKSALVSGGISENRISTSGKAGSGVPMINFVDEVPQ